MRLNPAAPGEQRHPMVGDTPMRRETLARMHATGTRVFDIGVLRLRKETKIADFEPVLESAAQLGASHAVVNGDEPDQSLLADLLARLCELGRGYGLTMNLEFTPWTGVSTLADALRIVEAAGRPEARVLIDTIHVDRSGGTADDIAATPSTLVAYAQVCDALRAMIRALPRDIPLSLEAPTKKLAEQLSALERARRGRAAVASLLAAPA
jgi:sugar phosphate isomerase/epimerase